MRRGYQPAAETVHADGDGVVSLAAVNLLRQLQQVQRHVIHEAWGHRGWP
jgi:hypothetical protein